MTRDQFLIEWLRSRDVYNIPDLSTWYGFGVLWTTAKMDRDWKGFITLWWGSEGGSLYPITSLELWLDDLIVPDRFADAWARFKGWKS